jgi:hypothetical protein
MKTFKIQMKKAMNIKFGENMELLFELVNISNLTEFVEIRYNVEGSHRPDIDLYKILKKVFRNNNLQGKKANKSKK